MRAVLQHLSDATLDSSSSSSTSTSASSPSVDLLLLFLVSVFVFITATAIRLMPWTASASARPRWMLHGDPILPVSYANYGATAHAELGIARAMPTYESMIELSDRIGQVKRGFTDEQIAILPTYVPRQAAASADAPPDATCVICRDPLAIDDTLCVLPCGDEFHAECIAPWLKLQASCPLCRCRFA